MKENRVRQADNLSRLTGFWRGRYFENGVNRPPKDATIPAEGPTMGQEHVIYRYEGDRIR